MTLPAMTLPAMWNSLFAIAAGSALDYYGSQLIFDLLGLILTPIPLPGLVVVGLWLGVGLGMDVAGGFLTGVVARRRKVLHAAVTGAIVCAAGTFPTWHAHLPMDPLEITGAVLLIPCEMLGGAFAARIPPRKPGPKGPSPPIANPF